MLANARFLRKRSLCIFHTITSLKAQSFRLHVHIPSSVCENVRISKRTYLYYCQQELEETINNSLSSFMSGDFSRRISMTSLVFGTLIFFPVFIIVVLFHAISCACFMA